MGYDKTLATTAQQSPPASGGTMRCQLPDGEMTFGALASGMTDVNHLQFRNRRV
jgi:hypothetical protein